MKTIQLPSEKKSRYVKILLICGALMVLIQLMFTVIPGRNMGDMNMLSLQTASVNRIVIIIAVVLGFLAHKEITGPFFIRLIKTIFLLPLAVFILTQVSLYQTADDILVQILAVPLIYCAVSLCLFNGIANGRSLIGSAKADQPK